MMLRAVDNSSDSEGEQTGGNMTTKSMRHVFGGNASDSDGEPHSHHSAGLAHQSLHTLPLPDMLDEPEQVLLLPGSLTSLPPVPAPTKGQAPGLAASSAAGPSVQQPRAPAQTARPSMVQFPKTGPHARQGAPKGSTGKDSAPKPAKNRRRPPPVPPPDRDMRTALQIFLGCCFGGRSADARDEAGSSGGSRWLTSGLTTLGLTASAAVAVAALLIALNTQDKLGQLPGSDEYVTSTSASASDQMDGWSIDGGDGPDSHYRPISRIGFGSKYQSVVAHNDVWAKVRC